MIDHQNPYANITDDDNRPNFNNLQLNLLSALKITPDKKREGWLFCGVYQNSLADALLMPLSPQVALEILAALKHLSDAKDTHLYFNYAAKEIRERIGV